MAISVPTDYIALMARYFRSRRPICSGQVAADLAYGYRGISSQANFVYAYRVHPMSDYRPVNAETTPFWTDTPVVVRSWWQIGGEAEIHLGERVSKVRMVADVEDGEIRLTTSDAAAAATAGPVVGRGQLIATQTLVDASGQVLQYYPEFRSRALEVTGKIYSYIIQEVVMLAAEFP